MNAEEGHYLKKLKLLQQKIEEKVSQSSRMSSGRNYLGTATWDRKKKLFDIKQILISSKYTINHIEVDSLDKIEDLKLNTTFFTFLQSFHLVIIASKFFENGLKTTNST